MTRAEINAKISGRILTYYVNGLTLKQAIDKVCGVAAYDCLVEELYHELRAKAPANGK